MAARIMLPMVPTYPGTAILRHGTKALLRKESVPWKATRCVGSAAEACLERHSPWGKSSCHPRCDTHRTKFSAALVMVLGLS